MKAYRSPKTVCLVILFLLLSAGDLSADYLRSFGGSGEEAETPPPPSRFAVYGKILYHTFWKQGLLNFNGEVYGRPGLGVSDLTGMGGEIEFDYHWRPYLVFAATLGGYQGKSGKYNLDIVTAYVLGTAKLQKTGRIADYYVGAGFGGYFSRMDADGTANALKPGMHGLLGINFHVTPKWDILLEDRLALTLSAEEGFGDLDLGGNFLMLGAGYKF